VTFSNAQKSKKRRNLPQKAVRVIKKDIKEKKERDLDV